MTLGLIDAGGFGSLLGPRQNNRVTSNGLNMTAKEFLARVWYYASNYEDAMARGKPADIKRNQRMAQEDIIKALADAVENDGYVVCNPGKLQRIATTVLQGRLKGVVVDEGHVDMCPLPTEGDAAAPPRAAGGGSVLTLDEAWRAFEAGGSMVDGNRTMPYAEPLTAETLRARGNAFLEANPNVNPEEFRNQIEETVDALFLE